MTHNVSIFKDLSLAFYFFICIWQCRSDRKRSGRERERERERGSGKVLKPGFEPGTPSVLSPQGYRCQPHKVSKILYTFLIHIRVLVFRNDKGSKQQGSNMRSQLRFISFTFSCIQSHSLISSHLILIFIFHLPLFLLGVMYSVWLYSLIQCVVAVLVIGVSVRLCLAAGCAVAGPGTRCWSTSACLKLCLGLVGSVGSIVDAPVSVLLNLRTSQCLYTCIAMVSCPLLLRQFTMCLLLLLTLNTHLQSRLGNRWVWTSWPCLQCLCLRSSASFSAIGIFAYVK